MTANTTLQITELDFDQIKTNLKNFLRSQSEFQDYDFEGSGMSVLLDILAYNTHYMGFYLNMVGNEMFLDTAQIRQSVISHAKLIGYTPESRHGAENKINILVTPSVTEDQNTTIITLSQYTRLLGSDIDGINYPFVVMDTNTAIKSGNTFSFSNVTIKQGDVVTRQFSMDPSNTSRRFDIPSANVDVNTLKVAVQEGVYDTRYTIYNRADNILDITGNTAAYFVEENENGNYSIYFGDDIIGLQPNNGSIIVCTYLDTVGSVANKINNYRFVDPVASLFTNNVIISAANSSYSGTEKESIDQIKWNAQYGYTAQNRAVTIDDYQYLVQKDFNNIDAVSVWGGEDNDPPVYGKVYLSLKTKQNYFLSNLEKENIKNTLISNRNVLTVIPEIIDPDYTYITIKGSVYYNPSLTSLSAEQIKQYVYAAITDYTNNELNGFTSTFRKSKLQNYIEQSEPSITASDLKVYLQKRVYLNSYTTSQYSINVNFPIKKGDYNNQIYTYPTIRVLDSSNNERTVLFEEVPSAFTGIDSISITNPGINYAVAPSITIVGDGQGATATASVAGGKIISITLTNKGSNYTKATVVIDGVGSGAVAIANLESKRGILRMYYSLPTGEKIIVNPSVGTIDYLAGSIVIPSLYTTGSTQNSFYDTDVLTFNLPIDSDVITPLRNRILTIDGNDGRAIQIDIKAES
jgi:hypothetical protein